MRPVPKDPMSELRACPNRESMLAAFFIVAAYLGCVDFGSRMMNPPAPVRALSAPNPVPPSVDVASRSADADSSRPADR
ncbi:MAG TPA: hypothetical protein VF319_02440 [Caldimonas sp.]